MRVIGLMSGTSYDAIEAAAADITVEGDALVLRPRGAVSLAYPDDVRRRISAALPPAAVTMEDVCRLDTAVGQAFAQATVHAVGALCPDGADLVVSHGQTVHHWVQDGTVRGTLQLGQPAWIAEATGLPVVSDLRARDVAAGGQGAPLVGLLDTLLLQGRTGTPAALNLGGIANVTVVAPGEGPVAFDTGPANALVDAAVRHFTQGARDYDEDGKGAAAGQVHAGLLSRLLEDPYYRREAPKSTGKELFHLPYLLDVLAAEPVIDLNDVLATLTRLTAVTVADACRAYNVTELIMSGGGVRNPVMTAMIGDELPGVHLLVSDDLGVPSDAKEALAFAVLGFLTVHGVRGALPSTTGARHESILGNITPGRGPLSLPAVADTPRRLRIVS